jgi:uncharacterized Zn finger protein
VKNENTMKIFCSRCGKGNEPKSILENGIYSWPQTSTIFTQCMACGEKFHVQIQSNTMIKIQITSAPGPEYKEIQKVNIPNLSIRIDPEYLHCWHQGKHYEFKEKEQNHS